MTSELFISATPKKISIALTEDKRLMEFQEASQASVSGNETTEDSKNALYSVGNIYLAKVRKLMPRAQRLLCECRPRARFVPTLS